MCNQHILKFYEIYFMDSPFIPYHQIRVFHETVVFVLLPKDYSEEMIL